MPCLSAPKVALPDVSLLLPKLSRSTPQIGLNLCCPFETPPIPGFPIIIPLGPFLALLGPAGDAVISLIEQIVELLNDLLDQIPPVTCPLE